MATQGLVTVKKDGAVALKIVVGDDGMHAKIVADAIRGLGHVPTSEEAYRLAAVAGFGCARCRVVVDPKGMLFKGLDGSDGIGTLYRDTFANPRFNPRWEYGTADYIEVVEL